MDSLDKKLLQAWLLALEDITDANEAELNRLAPAPLKAGYIEEKPWDDNPDWVLWSCTKKGVKRSEGLKALSEKLDNS